MKVKHLVGVGIVLVCSVLAVLHFLQSEPQTKQIEDELTRHKKAVDYIKLTAEYQIDLSRDHFRYNRSITCIPIINVITN
jgi:hypothetical protein